jgi:hypothetical protein
MQRRAFPLFLFLETSREYQGTHLRIELHKIAREVLKQVEELK